MAVMNLASGSGMPRKRVQFNPESPLHITARCLNKEWFELPSEVVWTIFEDYLFCLNKNFGIEIHSFVMMANHIHLLAKAPLGNLSHAMQYFMMQTSREITRLSGRINQTWGARYFKSEINGFHHYMNVYKYVYQNPLRANLCERVEDYPFSTIRGLLGESSIYIPLQEDTLLFNPNLDESVLAWLNRRANADQIEEMRRALRKGKFHLSTSRRFQRPSRLETELL